ncbi:peptidase S8/S53 domain-containing protein [Pilobolus umbonatus]|nr:peptidase S8/S53 domain-containing protein [Pilobolus umbonatus]
MLLKSISLGLLASLTIQASFISHSKLKRSENVSTASRWIVELNEGHSTSHDAVIRSLNEEYVNANVVLKRSFNHDLFDGFSVNIDASHENIKRAILHSVLNKKEVKSIYPVIDAKKSLKKRAVGFYDSVRETRLLLPHKMTQVAKVHKKLNVTGHGVLVGVIDTGFDYNHPAFGGGIGPDHKILFGYDIAGDIFEKVDPNIPYPDNNPIYTCDGGVMADSHGTHVAAIIAGYDPETEYTGVAPDAKLAVWKVSNCGAGLSAEAIVTSMLMAYDAKVDILNFSFASGIDEYAIYDLILEKLKSAGITVVAGASNEGREGFFSMKEPGSSVAAFTVGSVDNDYETFFVLNSKLFKEEYEILPLEVTNIKGGRLVVGSPDGVLCSPSSMYPNKNITGNVILVNGTDCLQGQITFLEGEQAGEIVVHSAQDYVRSTVPIYYLTGQNVDQLNQADGAIVDIDRFVRKKASARTISEFSSIGPTEYLEFKPNIVAPGGPIYSAIPVEYGGWMDIQGTSMAAPYAAGVVALYKSYLKDHDSQYIEEHFQNYAYSVNLINDNVIDNPIKQGAGLIQAYDALTQVNHISPAQISFNDTVNTDYHTQELTLSNNGDSDVTYRLFNNVTITILPYGDNIDKLYVRNTTNSAEISAEIQFSHDEVTVAPGESETVSVTVIPPTDFDDTHAIYGGFIQFDPLDQSGSHKHKPMHVPYFGALGNQRDVPILDTSSSTLLLYVNRTLYDSASTVHFTSGTTIDYNINIINPTNEIIVEVVDAQTNEPIGYLDTNKRNLSQLTFDSSFTGVYTPLLAKTDDLRSIGDVEYRVPLYPGTYYIRLKALKFFGDRSREEDWETRVSVPIIIENYVESYDFFGK